MSQDGDESIDWRVVYRDLEKQMEYTVLAAARTMDTLIAERDRALAPAVQEAQITVRDRMVRVIAIASGFDLEYAFAIYRDGVIESTSAYSRSNTFELAAGRSGEVRVRALVRTVGTREPVASRVTSTVTVGDPG